MEAFERAIGNRATTRRSLLSQLGDARSRNFNPQKTFLFGLGTLGNEHQEYEELSHLLTLLPSSTELIAVELPSGGHFSKLELHLLKQAALNQVEITAVSEQASDCILRAVPSAKVKVLGFLESLLEISPISSTETYVALAGVPTSFCISEPSIRIHFSNDKVDSPKEVGLTEFYVASFPWIGLKVLASASRIITSEKEIARIATCLGKDLSLVKGKDECDLAQDILTADLSQQREHWRNYLGLDSLVDSNLVAQEETLPLRLALVCDKRYFGFLIALCENLLEVHNGIIEVFLLWLGDQSEFTLQDRFIGIKFHLFDSKDIWPDDIVRNRISDWPTAEQAYAGKPAILKKALSLSKSPILLTDLDIWYFSSPISLFGLGSSQHNCIVFPQWSDRFLWLRHHGFINSGMLVVRPGSEMILDFWSRACSESSALSLSEGTFGDQGYLDYAVMLYEGCFIYLKGDEDVAPWNRETLRFSIPEVGKARFQVFDEIEVRSFHAAGPDSSGAFELKYLWDQMCSVFNVPKIELQNTPIWENTLHQQRRYSVFVDLLMRMNERWHVRFPRLFKYHPSALQKWSHCLRVLLVLSKVTMLLDRLRKTFKAPGKASDHHFDFKWKELHHLIIRHTRT